ncbi:MAG: chemotaxis protein CheW [Candidatus Omnitrophica bacterium]|nr:chemotaxis protein CheW [Candidatus Omnitrophota bacterium]
MPEINFEESTSRVARTIKQFVCFKLAAEEYAIDISYIQEVIRVVTITQVPQMPEFCWGVINVRGNVLPVFDLRRLFHLPEKKFDAQSKFLIASIGNFIASFIVDEIVDNIKLESSAIDPTPAVKMKIDADCIKGLGELDDRMIVIINLEKVHDHILKIINTFSKIKGPVHE